MPVFKVRINCLGFEDYVVEAKDEESAKRVALNNFQCDKYGTEGEFCEFMPLDKDFDETDEHGNFIPTLHDNHTLCASSTCAKVASQPPTETRED